MVAKADRAPAAEVLNRVVAHTRTLHRSMGPLLNEDPSAIWMPPPANLRLTPDTDAYRKAIVRQLGLPADAYEYTSGPVRVVAGVEIESWGGLKPALAEPYRSPRAPLRDFVAHAACPHCETFDCHWLKLVPVPVDEQADWGAAEVLVRNCRSCGLSWREAR